MKKWLYTNELKSWIFGKAGIPDFEPACIAQPFQVELLRRRFAGSNSWRRLCQKSNFSVHLCIFSIAIAVFLSTIALIRTDFVSVRAICPPFPTSISPNILMGDASKLQQFYTYLGSGRQSIVFLSEDGQTVLKFFRKSYIETPWYTCFLPYPQKEVAKRAKRRKFYEESYPLAAQFFKEETGLIYLHLKPTNHLPSVKVKTRSSQLVELDVNKIPFVLQKKAEPFLLPLQEAILDKRQEEVRERLSSFLAHLAKRISLCIIDYDRDIVNNFGWEGKKIFHLDPGRFCYDEGLKELSLKKEEWEKATAQLERFLKKQGPEYLPFFKEFVRDYAKVDSVSFEQTL